MPSICFYFQVHQPKRLRKYTIFDINRIHFYEADDANCQIFHKVANKCYLPTNKLMLDLIKRFNGEFKISYSISGTAIEQMKRFNPEVLDSFKRLVDTGCVELISETYYHSLSFLHSTNEFERQIQKHKELIQKEFGYTSQTFRNTELIYSNSVAATADRLGYKAILAEGTEKILGWRNANFVYQPINCSNIKVLLRNYQLSDDIAFRFSNRGWAEHPLTADKFSTWVHGFDGNAETINLFMDYETFGEHQWSETGIFDFMWALPEYLLSHTSFKFNTPSQVVDMYPVRDKLDVHNFVSWADTERDLSAWKGNNLQDDALESVFKLEEKVYRTKDQGLIETWQALLTSDHFYYMCTKWFSDGDVHKYFNPYQSPYEAYINYQNVLTDFEAVVNARMAQLQEIK
jgi:alpha-amylase